MSTEKNLDKIAKYLSDNMHPEERESLFAWVEESDDNKQEFEDSLATWNAMDGMKDTFSVDSDAAWGKMEQRLEQTRQLEEVNNTLEVVSLLKPILRIAAAAILLLMAGLWYNRGYDSAEMATISTQTTEKTTVDLPDGSRVWLNEHSVLQYATKFDKRVIHLEGEAFFEVTKKDGQTFEIVAGDSKTTVLGTSFNVRAYPEETFVEVAVETGKVQFTSLQKTEETVLLEKKEYATLIKATTEVNKQQGTKPNAIAWKNQALYLGEAKMDQAVEALERYFAVDITVKDKAILNCSWGNTIDQLNKPNLETLIEQINFGNPYEIKKIAPKQYILFGEGCLE